ncbi:MAG: hypothetical protein DRJ35_05890 [Thermoprotei archaeon]|nr:MAG: hypothetical protein DRJ35_05890 [Thermoprotei archaeon]
MTYGFERIGDDKWDDPFECGPAVFWRPKKYGDRFIVATYGWPDATVKLLSSKDGRNWTVESTILEKETGGNETDLWIEGDKIIAFSRRENPKGEYDMLISVFNPSKNKWKTTRTGRTIHAPCVFSVRDKLFISGRYCVYSHDEFAVLTKEFGTFGKGGPEAEKIDPARVEHYHHGLHTGIFLLDGKRPRLIMELLSAGDSSYTGVVRYEREYVIIDYTMHEYYRPICRPGDWETPCDIYMSRIRFKNFKE